MSVVSVLEPLFDYLSFTQLSLCHQSMYEEWCKLFCKCIDVCIHLLKINYDQWNAIRSFKFKTLAKSKKTLCSTCHNEDVFDRWLLPSKYCYTLQEDEDIKEKVLKNVTDIEFYQYSCKVCGHKTTVNVNETPLNIITCFSSEGLPPGSKITKLAHLVRGTEDPYCQWYTVQTEGTDVITPLLIPD